MTKPTMQSLITEIEADLSLVGDLPIDPNWMYEVIRHGQRNLDVYADEGFNEPSRYAGRAIGRILNLLPQLIEASKA